MVLQKRNKKDETKQTGNLEVFESDGPLFCICVVNMLMKMYNYHEQKQNTKNKTKPNTN